LAQIQKISVVLRIMLDARVIAYEGWHGLFVGKRTTVVAQEGLGGISARKSLNIIN